MRNEAGNTTAAIMSESCSSVVQKDLNWDEDEGGADSCDLQWSYPTF